MSENSKASPESILRNWLPVLRRDKAIESMQEKLQQYFDQSYDPSNKVSLSNVNADIKSYNGPTTAEGTPHGHGRMTFSDGLEFEGEFDNGKRKGYGKMMSRKQETQGYFHNDMLVGSVTRITRSKAWQLFLSRFIIEN